MAIPEPNPLNNKNPGPLLTSYVAGDATALPTEWRAKMGFVQEDQQMPLGYAPEIVDGVIVESHLIQTRTDERKRTTVLVNPPPENGGVIPPGGGPPDSWMLVSEERIPNGQVAVRTRAFVPEGSHLVLTDDMLTAEQRNLGIGALDQVVLQAPIPGPQITDTKWDETASLVSTIKRRKLVSQIVDSETIIGGVWQQTSREGETATVASEVVVTRTLPGPALVSTRIDQDNTIIDITKTKKETATIVSGETIVGNVWQKRYKDGETQLLATEIVEHRTLPGATVISTEFDPESVLVTTKKTRKQAITIQDGETIVDGVWKKIYHTGESSLVALEIEESRTLPGPTLISWRIEDNGTLVTIAKTKKLTVDINEGETATSTLWTRTYGEGQTQLISLEVVETRALPTPAVPTSRFDDDSTVVEITRQRRLASEIVTDETVTPTVWQKRFKEAESGLIATQVTETRALPGAALITSHFDNDGTLVTVTRTKRKSDTFTDGETIVGNVWTQRTREGITAQVAYEIVTSRIVPGQPVTSFRLDDDGVPITIVKTKKSVTSVNEGETATVSLWTRTFAEEKTQLLCTEVVETRALGISGATVHDSRFDNEGFLVTFARTKKQDASFIDDETFVGGIWKRIYRERISGLVSMEVIEQRAVPSAPITSFRIDDDGAVVTVVKTVKLLANIAEGETATTTVWTKTFAEGRTELLATEVEETRDLGVNAPVVKSVRKDPDGLRVDVSRVKKKSTSIVPSNTIETSSEIWTKVYSEPISGQVATEVTEVADLDAINISVVSTKLDDDGRVVTITKTRKRTANITSSAALTNNVWIKTYKEHEDGPVATEVKEEKTVPGGIVRSGNVDGDLVVHNTTRQLKDQTAVNAGVTIAGSIITVTEEKEVSNLVSEELITTHTFLDKARYSLSIENPLPPQFRTLAKISESSNVVAGTATLPANLLGTELEKSEEQVNKVTKRKTVKAIDTGNFPQAFSGKEITTEYGGLLLQTERKIDVANAASIDILPADVTNKAIVRAKLDRFGGFGVREKATATTTFPLLIGGNVDPETNFVERYTQQVVDEGAEASAGLGTVTEIKPLDAARSLKTIRTVNTASLNTFKLVFPGTTNVNLPPQLVSIVGYNAGSGGGTGLYVENGSYTIVNNGNGQISLRGEAHSSAAASMDVNPVVKQVWGQNVKTTNYLFFMSGASITYDNVLNKLRQSGWAGPTLAEWPKFSPQTCTVTVISGTAKARAEAVKSFSDTITSNYLGQPTRAGSARTEGGGVSTLYDIVVKTITIPPTIHPALTIATTTAASGTFSAASTINIGGVKTANTSSSVTARITPTTFAATPGRTTIPTSGLFLHKMRVEPWKYGYFKLDCEVVNAADW